MAVVKTEVLTFLAILLSAAKLCVSHVLSTGSLDEVSEARKECMREDSLSLAEPAFIEKLMAAFAEFLVYHLCRPTEFRQSLSQPGTSATAQPLAHPHFHWISPLARRVCDSRSHSTAHPFQWSLCCSLFGLSHSQPVEPAWPHSPLTCQPAHNHSSSSGRLTHSCSLVTPACCHSSGPARMICSVWRYSPPLSCSSSH